MKLTVVLFLLLLSTTQGTFAQNCCIQPRLITVTGTAEINVAPDEVVLSLGIESRDKDLGVAKGQHDARVKKIIADARKSGVDSKDIQTNAVSMTAEYSEEKVPRFLAYEMTQTVEITLKDLSKYETLISQLLVDGVNRIHSVEFTVRDNRKYKDEARLRAIRAAREKASAMAIELGQSIGKPWTIFENSANANYYLANANTSFGYMGKAVEEGSTVAPGEVSIRASVNVSFELQ